jgi:hypothetical protein
MFIPHLGYHIVRILAFTDQPGSLRSQLEGCSLFQQGVENRKKWSLMFSRGWKEN